ncbi:MAG: hypothetical protein KatS3mg131_2185 [Candidatus Tectimicrobiota bacterium]|nr:MAG: hypothetical protein KatS3mg131_2185 [Candidatus Tectomicrobia bacterium]
MTPQTTMQRYQGVVLECQHCYALCRYRDAAVRRTCPGCGHTIANWEELTAALCREAPSEEAPSS